MSLINKLGNREGITLVEGLLTTAIIGFIGVGAGLVMHEKHVKRNLEPNAIHTRQMYVESANKDLDKNGKYESILYYQLGKNKRSVLLQYDKEKGYIVTKPYTLTTDSVTNKKTLKILE